MTTIVETIKAMFGETISPDSHRLPRNADGIGNLAIVHAVDRAQHDLGPLRLAA